MVTYTDKHNISGIILRLDFEKAFNTIEWEFIWKTLQKYNFSPKFINMIKLCYNDIESTVINNGEICGWFKLSRGIGQGCPISGQLFLFDAETVAHLIRTNNNMHGVHIEGFTYKSYQFADDENCSVRDWESVK